MWGYLDLIQQRKARCFPFWHAQFREGKVDFGHQNSTLKFPFSLINTHLTKQMSLTSSAFTPFTSIYIAVDLFVFLALKVCLFFMNYVSLNFHFSKPKYNYRLKYFQSHISYLNKSDLLSQSKSKMLGKST